MTECWLLQLIFFISVNFYFHIDFGYGTGKLMYTDEYETKEK